MHENVAERLFSVLFIMQCSTSWTAVFPLPLEVFKQLDLSELDQYRYTYMYKYSSTES